MSDLGANHLVVMANKRVIRNLAISFDHQFQASLGGVLASVDLAAGLDPTVGTWVNRGLSDRIETLAGVALPVPRLLYATTNPHFGPVPVGITDRDTLINRLGRYDAFAAGPVVDTLPANAEIAGVPLNNPCPIEFKADPNRRFTFLRGGFFTNNAPSFLDVTPNGLEMTISGTAYRGDLFSRYRAMYHFTHTFQMKLRYTVQPINDSDLNVDRVPFRMVTDPPAPTWPDLPSLPANGSFVFASRFFDQQGELAGYELPHLVPDPNIPQILVQPPNLHRELFRGELDDLIYESQWSEPRFRVEPKSDAEPERFVIREIGSSTILAEAVALRLALDFGGMVSLDLQPDDVGPTDKALIASSLSKIHPTMSQDWTCANGMPAAETNMYELSMLGPEGLDFPLMPRSVVVANEAEIVEHNSNKPGPLNSVWSDVTTCDLTAIRMFSPEQVFGVAGIIGGSGDPNFNEFSAGADVAIGVSENFVEPWLKQAADRIRGEIMGVPPGLDDSTLQVTGTIDTDAFVFDVYGEGEIETPFFLPNIGYNFTAAVRARFQAEKVVMRKGEDRHPVDRFGCPIVYDLASGPAPAGDPLCYEVYFDPDDGIACFGNCPLPVRIPPPVLNASGYEIPIGTVFYEDLENPPNICPEQGADDTRCYGAESFELSENAGLKHEWALVQAPPTDADIAVNVNINLGSVLLAGLLGVLGLALGAPLTFFSTGGVIASFRTVSWGELIAEAVASGDVMERIAKKPPETLDTSLVGVSALLGLHLEDPAERPSFALQPGALITRFHVLVETEGLNVGA